MQQGHKHSAWGRGRGAARPDRQRRGEVLQLGRLLARQLDHLGREARKLGHVDAERLVARALRHLPRHNTCYYVLLISSKAFQLHRRCRKVGPDGIAARRAARAAPGSRPRPLLSSAHAVGPRRVRQRSPRLRRRAGPACAQVAGRAPESRRGHSAHAESWSGSWGEGRIRAARGAPGRAW